MKQRFFYILFVLGIMIWIGCDAFFPKEDYIISNNEWFIKFYGGQDDDAAISGIETNDNGFLMVGTTKSYAVGSTDGYIIKTNEYGTVEWSKTFGGLLNDRAVSVAKLGEDFIMLGDSAYNINATNMVLSHLLPDGRSIWREPIEGSEPNVSLLGKEVMINSKNQIVVLGNEQVDGNTKILVSVWEDQQLLWQRTYGYGTVSTEAAAVIESNNGNIVVLGTVDTSQMVLIELDELGGENKVNFFGGENSVIANDFYQNSQNEFVLLGTFQSGLYLGKVGEEFQVIGEDIMEAPRYGDMPIGASIFATENDTLIVAATYNKLNNNNQFRYFLLSKRVFGEEVWLKAYGDTTSQQISRDNLKTVAAFKTNNDDIALIGTHDFLSNSKLMLLKVNSGGNFK